MKFAAVGFTCIDEYKNLGISYPTGNGVDLMFNLIDMMPDIEAHLVTSVGDDEGGRDMTEACRARRVDTSRIHVVEGGTTARIEMLLNGRDRVHHKTHPGVMEGWHPTDDDTRFLSTTDAMHTDLSWDVVPYLPKFRENGARIFFDFSKRYQRPEVSEILGNINWGLFSFEEETDEVRALLQSGVERGADVVIATFGEKGSLACDADGFHRGECIPCPELVNTVGAGDSFGAGFMYGVLNGMDTDRCLIEGAKKSSEIVGIFEPYHRKAIRTSEG